MCFFWLCITNLNTSNKFPITNVFCNDVFWLLNAIQQHMVYLPSEALARRACHRPLGSKWLPVLPSDVHSCQVESFPLGYGRQRWRSGTPARNGMINPLQRMST